MEDENLDLDENLAPIEVEEDLELEMIELKVIFIRTFCVVTRIEFLFGNNMELLVYCFVTRMGCLHLLTSFICLLYCFCLSC